MKVFIGVDHRGFKLKEFLKGWLMGMDYEVVDCGAEELDEEDDYVDFAVLVGQQVMKLEEREMKSCGIVICGSGVGVCVVANKFKGVRCGLGLNEEQVGAARRDDDINVLALAVDYVDAQQAKEMVKAFLETEFSGEERHKRRLEKISNIEK